MTSGHESNPAGSSVHRESCPCLRRPLGRDCSLSVLRWPPQGWLQQPLLSFGGDLALAGCVGWFLQVLPHERHEIVPVTCEPVSDCRVTPHGGSHRRSPARPHRARLPLEIYPVSAGIKGGLAGSVAMAALAMLYGVVSHGSIWYPINLLGGGGLRGNANEHRMAGGFPHRTVRRGTLLHLTGSILVGLLYGALLPMLPRRPILSRGSVRPARVDGLALHGSRHRQPDSQPAHRLAVVPRFANRVRNRCGLVVVRQVRVPTWQFPLAVRAGVETPGVMGEGENRPS